VRNLNQPNEVAKLLAEVDQALAALQPKSYEDATWLVNQGLREKFLAELRHPLNNESAIAIAGGQISAKFDAFIAICDKTAGWSSHVRG
jgi:hypothetical protein